MVSLAKPMAKNNSMLLSPILLDINDLLYLYNSIALLVVDMLQPQHVPILNMYSLLLVETTNDMSFHNPKQSMTSLFR